MAVTHLLGIDFETGGAKACVVDDQCHVLAYAFREHPILYSRPGWSEHDPETYWRVTCEIVGQVLRESHCLPHEIAGIAVSSAQPSMVLVDDEGNPVAPATNLMDRRALDEVNIIRDIVGESTIEQVTANRIEDHPNLVNLYWCKRNRPQIYRRIHKALTIDGFIVSRLTKRFSLNSSSAVLYGVAFDIRAGAFREDILDKLEIDPAILPTSFDPTDLVGEITADAARITGLNPGTPVVAGQAACKAGWIAGGAIQPGDMQLNLGTRGVLGAVHQNMDFLESPDGLRWSTSPIRPHRGTHSRPWPSQPRVVRHSGI